MVISGAAARHSEGSGTSSAGSVAIAAVGRPDEAQARKTMHRLWPTDAIPGEAAQLLPLPRHFGQLAEMVTPEMVTAPCGPSVDAHVEGVRAFTRAGFDEVYISQVGPEADGFFEFYGSTILPRLRDEAA